MFVKSLIAITEFNWRQTSLKAFLFFIALHIS
jgi:hypothetical protein